MKKFLVLMLALILAIGCLFGAACGAEEDGDKIKLTVAINSDGAENTLMKRWKEEYEKLNPEIQITFKQITSNYTQALMSYEQSPKNMPDIIWTTGEQHVAWSEKGIFINLKERFESDPDIDLDDIYDSMIEVTHKSSKDNGIYFAPRDYNKCVIVINKVMFKHCGFSDDEIANLKEDWNYEKFLNVCQKLRAAMDEDLDTKYGVRKESVPLDARMDFNAVYMSFIKYFGGSFVDNNGKVNFISDANLEAYGKIYELIEKRYISPQGKMASTSFTNLKAAMRIDVRPQIPNLPKTDKTDKYDYDFLPLPIDCVGAGCSGYAISKMAKERVSTSSFNTQKLNNEEYAYRFIKYIISAEGQKVGAATGSIVPMLKSLANDESWTTYLNADMNHAAFTSYPEKDFNLNVYRDFDPQASQKILTKMGEVIASVLNEDNYPEGYKESGYQKLKESLKGFQSFVSGYTAA